MKIVHVGNYDGGDGGHIAAYRLHSGLQRLGHDSSMFVCESRNGVNDPTVMLYRPATDLMSRIRRRLRHERIIRKFSSYRNSRPVNAEFFTDDRTPHGGDLLSQLPAADVIHVHAFRLVADYQAFLAKVPNHTPVVRTMHDMNFFTGGCHYDQECGKFAERCGACPQLGSQKENDLSRQIWQRKHAALTTVDPRHLYPVTPSRWLAEEARRSSLLRNFPITVIPLGLDTDAFCPRDRTLAREVLGVPQDARVILFVAEPITRRHKGFALLAQALSGLNGIPKLLLMTAGSGKAPAEVAIPHLRLDHIPNERLLSFVYSAADIFVIPSLQEVFGQTALEAIACGTPVVGFSVGGIPDMVRLGVTGLLAPPQDVAALRGAINDLLQDPEKQAEISANCRRIALEEYSLEVQARHYVQLYERILARLDQHPGHVGDGAMSSTRSTGER